MRNIVMLALVLPLLASPGAPPPDAASGPAGQLVAQFISPRCATPEGICFVSPMPVGSPCQCGQFFGTIIP